MIDSKQTDTTQAIGESTPIPVASTARSTGGPSSDSKSVQREDVVFRFQNEVETATTLESLLKSVAVLLSSEADSMAVWIAPKDASGSFEKIHAVLDENDNPLWPIVGGDASRLIPIAANTKKIVSRPLDSNPHHQLVAAPVVTNEGVTFVLASCFDQANHSPTRQHWLMGIASQAIANWYHRQTLNQTEIKSKSRNDALMLFQALDRTDSTQQATMTIVNHLRRILNAHQVALTLSSHPMTCDLTAISDVENIDRLAESNKALITACRQAVFNDQLLVYNSNHSDSEAKLLPLKNFCDMNKFAGCVNIPLKTEQGNSLGALLIALNQQQIENEEFVEYLKSLTGMVANHLSIVLKANRGISDVAKSGFTTLARRKWTRPLLIGFALMCCVLCIPWPYRVACDCELQPTFRRFVSAPHAGILEKTLVKNGDVIEKGQVIATMDGRSLRIELAGLVAELDGAQKKRESALARGDVALSYIARSEMKRLESDITLIRDKLTNLEIKSPIDGIVVSGDLEHVQGAPLEMGQSLFEVGPLDKMLAEIAIPESEIQYIQEGMSVAIKLNAFPFEKWTGTIEKIHPRAEIVDDETVFIAEVRLPNDDLLLKPGLAGTAKIQSNSYPLGWNYFHRAWESVRYWTIW